MTERKLASIRRIGNIDPIEGADNIVKLHVDGWSLVSAKANKFMPGDLICYFEIDSFLPIEERFEFLRKGCFKSTKHLGDGFRIKTVKLKGTLSQGLAIPLVKGENDEGRPCYFITDSEGNKHEVSEGDDVTEILKVQKYEKPIPANLSGKIKGTLPSLIRKTDQERIQNIYKELAYDLKAQWEVSLKLDGSSMTVYKKGDILGVCSRNMELYEDDENLYWRVARNLRIPEMLQWHGKNIAFQGELMGPGVQSNREWLKTHTFFLFDVWDIDRQRYYSPDERIRLVKAINDSGFELPHVHVFGTKTLGDFGKTDEEILTNVLQFAQGPSIYNSVREGIVFKRLDGGLSFKAISQEYLLKDKD